MIALRAPQSHLEANLTSVKVPDEPAVHPAVGLVILNTKPVTPRFVAYMMSEEVQAIIRSHGREPVASLE